MYELENRERKRRFKKIMQMFSKKKNTYYFLKNIRRINIDIDIKMDDLPKINSVFKVYFDEKGSNIENKEIKDIKYRRCYTKINNKKIIL